LLKNLSTRWDMIAADDLQPLDQRNREENG